MKTLKTKNQVGKLFIVKEKGRNMQISVHGALYNTVSPPAGDYQA